MNFDNSNEEDSMAIHLTSALLAEAQAILEDNGGINAAVKIHYSGHQEIAAILSPTPDDIIALEKIIYRGKEYYLGIPDGSGVVS